MQQCATAILNTIRDFIKSLLEKLMKEERSLYLKENPHTKANGYYKRSTQSFFGKIVELVVPRTRDSIFKSQLVPKGSCHQNLERLANMLFKQGVSTRNIEAILKECFGVTLSHATVSKLSSVAYEELIAWKMRPLKAYYSAIYIDAFYFPLKRDTTAKEAFYVALGICPNGQREVLGFWIPGGAEGAHNWEEIFQELKARGVLKVDLIVADGLTGIRQTIERQFPSANYQLCVLHATRNCLNKVRVKDKKEIGQDMKTIYLASCSTEAQKALKKFTHKWGKIYPKVVEFWQRHFESLTAFMVFPVGLWRYLYTTNCIERLHKEIKRRIKSMEQFQNEISAEKILYMLYRDQNKRYEQTGCNEWEFLYSQFIKDKRNQKIVA